MLLLLLLRETEFDRHHPEAPISVTFEGVDSIPAVVLRSRQVHHAHLMLKASPGLARLRERLVQTVAPDITVSQVPEIMSKERFWRVYFLLLEVLCCLRDHPAPETVQQARLGPQLARQRRGINALTRVA